HRRLHSGRAAHSVCSWIAVHGNRDFISMAYADDRGRATSQLFRSATHPERAGKKISLCRYRRSGGERSLESLSYSTLRSDSRRLHDGDQPGYRGLSELLLCPGSAAAESDEGTLAIGNGIDRNGRSSAALAPYPFLARIGACSRGRFGLHRDLLDGTLVVESLPSVICLCALGQNRRSPRGCLR